MSVINTPKEIELYRLCTLRTMLRLEILGMSRSKAPSALSMLRKMGYKGDREKVLAQVVADINGAFEFIEE
jgi:succinylarginine dihydrolase